MDGAGDNGCRCPRLNVELEEVLEECCLSRESKASMQKLELDDRLVPLAPLELAVDAVVGMLMELDVMVEGIINDEEDGGDEEDTLRRVDDIGFHGRFLLEVVSSMESSILLEREKCKFDVLLLLEARDKFNVRLDGQSMMW